MPRVSAGIRRQQLIEAAVGVLAEEGLAAATTRRIAEAAGVPLASVHYCFRDKDELLHGVIEVIAAEIESTLIAAITPRRGLRQAVEDSGRAFWALVEATPGLQTLQYELAAHAIRRPQSAWLAELQYRRYEELATRLFETVAAEAGESCAVPFDRLARLAVAGVDGLILQHLAHRDQARSLVDLQTLTQMLIGLADPQPK